VRGVSSAARSSPATFGTSTCHSEHPVYENLVTEVIRDAIASGAKRLEMGQTSAPLKSRLGAVESRRFLFLRHRLRPAHRALRALAPLLFPAGSSPARRVFKRAA
jgi:hypothetical protein